MGDPDAFVRSYDSGGTLRWTREFGTNRANIANGIATDANGSVYATGRTFGALDGTSAGRAEAFIRTYGPRRRALS